MSAVGALTLGVPTEAVMVGMLTLTGLGWCLGMAAHMRRSGRPKAHHNPEPTVSPAISHFEQASFLAKVCHEIRTPLHNIMGLVNIVAHHTKDKTQRHYLQLVQEASNHLLNTINGVLDFSKANTGMLSVSKKGTRIDEVVRQALRTVAPQAYQKSGLELLCQFDTDVPLHVDTDATRVTQILINLLGNAIKFTSAGCVTLRVSIDKTAHPHGPSLLFEVSDTGAGIPDHELGSIFDPFSQVDMTIVRKASGTGLGLTIVKQLVTLLGGEVGVSSELKVGSTFWFTLPIGIGAVASETAPRPDLQGRQVCVVTRGHHFAELARASLAECGAKVTVFDALRSVEITARSSEFYIISEDVVSVDESEAFLRRVVEQGMTSSVALFLSPSSFKMRHKCEELAFPHVASLPAISTDIIDVVGGQFKPLEDENFAVGLAHSDRALHVLIADDLPTNLVILRTLLEDAGHQVTSVSDGDELVALVTERLDSKVRGVDTKGFDLVLTDIQMPRVDGISAIQQIRALETSRSSPPLPLVAITAHALEDERRRIINAGANDILSKPFKPQDLERILELASPCVNKPDVACRSAAHVSLDSGQRFVRDALGAVRQQLGDSKEHLLDVQDLFERSGDSPRRSLLILKSFIDCYGPVLDELNLAEQGSSVTDIGRVAHKVKGLFAEVGAKGVSAKAAHLEDLSSQGSLEDLVALVPGLLAEAQRVAKAVEAVVESSSSC